MCHPRHTFDGRHVTDHEDVGMTRDRQIGKDFHTSGTVEFDAGLVGEVAAERAGRNAGRPHLACGFDTPHGAVGVLDRDAVAVDVGDHGVELDLHAHLLQPVLRLLAELLTHRRQHRGRGVEQDHPCLRRIDMAERTFEGVVGQFGDLPGHFDTGRPRADDDEGEQLLAAGRVAGPLRLFESAQDPAAQLEGVVDGLHAGSPFGEVVVSEVRLARAGSHDQAVERGDVGVAQQLRANRLGLQVDPRHVAEENLRVLLLAQDHPGRRRDLALRDDAGRDLVQQRLKQVVGGARDHLDVDVGVLQPLGGGQSTETRSDDDHLVAIAWSGSRMAHCNSLSRSWGTDLLRVFLTHSGQRKS